MAGAAGTGAAAMAMGQRIAANANRFFPFFDLNFVDARRLEQLD